MYSHKRDLRELLLFICHIRYKLDQQCHYSIEQLSSNKKKHLLKRDFKVNVFSKLG